MSKRRRSSASASRRGTRRTLDRRAGRWSVVPGRRPASFSPQVQGASMSLLAFLLAWLLPAQVPAPVLENEYVRVHADAAPCASAATAGCADRVIVAMADVSLRVGPERRA